MNFDEWIKDQRSIRLDFKLIDLRRDAYNAGLEAAALIAEEIERKHFDTVGNPMITTFTPWIAKAIREVT